MGPSEGKDVDLKEYIRGIREEDPKQLEDVIPLYKHTKENPMRRAIDR